MYPLRMVRQAFRLPLLVTLVVLAMSACGGGSQDQANKLRHLPQNNATLRPDKLATSIGGGGGDPLLIFRNVQKVFKPGTDTAVKAPK